LQRVISHWDLVSAEILSRRRFSKPISASSTGSAEPIAFTEQPKRELTDCAGCFCSKSTARIRVVIVSIQHQSCRAAASGVSPRQKDLGVFAALGAYHFFLQTGDQHRKTTRSVEYDYGKFIVVAGLASGCTSRDPWPP
jgi:hypothetical protein